MIYSKLRYAMLLLPMLGVSGVVGYASASLIGMGWTIGLCFLLFTGVIGIVLVVQKNEDMRMEQQFEQVLKPLMFHETMQEAKVSAHQQEDIETFASYEVFEEYQVGNDESEARHDEVLVETSQSNAMIPEIIPDEEQISETISSFDLSSESLQDEECVVEMAETTEVQEIAQEPKQPESSFLQENLDHILSLSQSAEKFIQQKDYLHAYKALKEALSYSPPFAAKYLLSRQLVQVLNEMGLYQESIGVMETMLSELPAGSSKKRDDLHWQISYLEMLTHYLQAEQKRNLSWSLIPSEIHKRVTEHYYTLVTDGNQKKPAIPFQ